MIVVKRHISSLANKRYKTSKVKAVKENAEKKAQGWFVAPLVLSVSELRPERFRGRDLHTSSPGPIAVQ